MVGFEGRDIYYCRIERHQREHGQSVNTWSVKEGVKTSKS